jgi:hypothetical protein
MSTRQQKRRLKRRRASVRAGVVGGGALALTLIPAGIAQASPTFKVTNLHNSGNGSLREALEQASKDTTITSTPVMITFSSKLSGSIDLQSQLPRIYNSVDIKGPGARRVTLNAAKIPDEPGKPVIYDNAPNTELTISGLSMDNAFIFNFGGSFLEVDEADLTLKQDTFAGDRGAYVGGAVSDTNSPLTIEGCTFTDNRADNGGAIGGSDGLLKIEDSTFVGNHASYVGAEGGAIIWYDADVELLDSTVTGDAADFTETVSKKAGYGGGLAVANVNLFLYDSIVAGNTASGNVDYVGHVVGGSDFRDIYRSQGGTFLAEFSLIQHDTSDLTAGLKSTDITGKSPDLGPLKNNGGPTNTELPFAKSPVINAGRAFGLKVDQRGDKRTVDYPGVKKRKGSTGTDIGAVELQAPKRKHRR